MAPLITLDAAISLKRLQKKTGLTIEQAEKELQNRTKILKWMTKKNIRNYKDVSSIIRSYLENPSKILAQAEA